VTSSLPVSCPRNLRSFEPRNPDASTRFGTFQFSPLLAGFKPHAPFNRSDGYRLYELDLTAQIYSFLLCSLLRFLDVKLQWSRSYLSLINDNCASLLVASLFLPEPWKNSKYQRSQPLFLYEACDFDFVLHSLKMLSLLSFLELKPSKGFPFGFSTTSQLWLHEITLPPELYSL
jgi:hypothetical protein